MFRRGARRLVSSDEEPLMSAGRDVARVCTTQIDDASSRMIPSTATLARVAGECSPCLSDVIDALEDDLAPHRVAHVEVGPRCDVDRVVPCQSAVRWIDMTRGDDEEGGDVHQRVEEGRNALSASNDHPIVWCWAWRHRTGSLHCKTRSWRVPDPRKLPRRSVLTPSRVSRRDDPVGDSDLFGMSPRRAQRCATQPH